MKLRIKYFEGATKLKKISKGNWIDVYANEDIFVPSGEQRLIPLGFALELPQGWEAHLAPRSSTFKTWGIIQTNSVGVVDDTYIGDNDQWHMPVYSLQSRDKLISIKRPVGEDGEFAFINENNKEEILRVNTCSIDYSLDFIDGVWIHKGDKIGQFRIMEVMPSIEFEEVASFGNKDRGGFGSTGSK